MKKVKKNKKISKASKLTPFLFLFFLMFGVISLFYPFPEVEEISLSKVVSEINSETIQEIIVIERELHITYKTGQKVKAIKEIETGISALLLDLGTNPEKLKNLEIRFEQQSGISSWIGPLILSILPIAFFLLFFFIIFKQAKTGAMQSFDFTKAKARLFGAGTKQKEKITFKDVAGLKEAKQELEEIIDFLKNPKKYLQMGAKIPRGVLLIGPPGTGKTMLARAVATEANVPFFSISGSEFIELFVGVGASRTRSLFSQAKKVGRAIIFIDEIDSIGRTRGIGFGGGHEEREQTLNQILSEMDGFERDSKIIVMAATNRPDVLDPALLRPGRFDRRIVLELPDIKDRQAILKIHSKEKPLDNSVELREIAERTSGFSGADLESLANEAAILAAKRNKTQIFQKEFLESIEKVLLGPERKSYILSKQEKEIAAFHEAGHALVIASLSKTEIVRKVSIIARGLAAGYTLKMPKQEKKIKTKSEFLADMAVLLGGYCAEKLRFKEITTGASNDLKIASHLARKLVKEYGMSCFGPIVWGENQELAFFGNETEKRNYSEEIAAKIDKEVTRFINQAEETATSILSQKKKLLEKLAKILIEKETIEKQEFERLCADIAIP
ncbi:MAG: ATP-dependent zinc metalloprotease FtsH [Candidatus Pacebacteria bacterium]|nr:ATP-dependent zinc metalloprotease FtsH [Candidatus Paceibacterota bacterium]